ncbi:Glutamate--tRNA ligase [Sulfitobacter sp. THAF37]|uniref:tRNA glutamyl-Q(34) synthetase GluQRS n=1 Tax=Sulfitobacter sp. THAF37 TaxID=2587855 RepID=UPI00126870B6|nr:tRNA glutamyl-Q(34) synthetase GluQRS [Sulfitobacter sp. THAF37]QFT60051.1 Glutamate--tRNA ligase [Sulfitobacter sp. THAF37]
MTFRTRFAPSPTGPLHLGHAYSAILAHDMAREAGGDFLVRMENTDLQRSKPQWEALILEDLAWLGLTWTEPVLRQSDKLDSYEASLTRLQDLDLLYPCGCSRKDIRAAAAAPQEGAVPDVYPGTCKHRDMASRQPGDALRLHMDRALAIFGDDLPGYSETGPKHAGYHRIAPEQALSTIGDVVLYRKNDGIIAYFLASALDDVAQDISHVVRGEDLFDFTAIQVLLLALLGLPVPAYHHHRLIRDKNGKRLAKRDDARAISLFRAGGKTPGEIRSMVGL